MENAIQDCTHQSFGAEIWSMPWITNEVLSPDALALHQLSKPRGSPEKDVSNERH